MKAIFILLAAVFIVVTVFVGLPVFFIALWLTDISLIFKIVPTAWVLLVPFGKLAIAAAKSENFITPAEAKKYRI